MANDRFEEIEKIVALELGPVGFDHNLDHVQRVYNLCIKIAKSEGKVNLIILRVAALLHDIGYRRDHKKGTDRHDEISAEMAVPILIKYKFTQYQTDNIIECILSHRFRADHKPESIEAKILFDADKLDGLGAVGLLRGGIWLAKKGANPFSTENPKDYIQTNFKDGK